jgi:hypothetical protein
MLDFSGLVDCFTIIARNERFTLFRYSGLILNAISLGYCYGFDVMEITGLPCGAVYPGLLRLERDECVESNGSPKRRSPPSGVPRTDIINSLLRQGGLSRRYPEMHSARAD